MGWCGYKVSGGGERKGGGGMTTGKRRGKGIGKGREGKGEVGQKGDARFRGRDRHMEGSER